MKMLHARISFLGLSLRCLSVLLIFFPKFLDARYNLSIEGELSPTSEIYVSIAVDPIPMQCNTEGELVSLAVIASGGDGPLVYSASNLPTGLSINNSSGLISGTVDPNAYTGTAYAVVITVDDSDLDMGDVETINFSWNIYDSPVVLYRINAGGPQITAIDGAMDWGRDEKNNPSIYLKNGGSNSASSHGGMNNFDVSVDLTTTPTSIYTTERWDIVGGSQVEYEFPLTAGAYELRLYLGNEDGSSSTPGTRVFDISVEDAIPAFLKDIDLSDQFGHRIGGAFTYPLIVNDGALNIKLFHNIKNPIINGIEIISGDLCNPPSAFPITLTPFPNQYNEEGQSINLSVLASGGDGNLVYTATSLPPSLTLDPSSGLISGTIGNTAAAGSPYAVTITVDDMNVGDVNTETTNFVWEVYPSGTPIIDAWTLLEPQISPTHTGRHENSMVKAGNRFYLLGGRESPKQVEVYDFINRSWSVAGAQAPEELNHFQPISHAGYIWVIGAYKNNNFPSESPADNIYLYDPLADAWETGVEVPLARRRGSAGAVLYKDKIYLVGGNTNGHNGGYVKWFDEYDPATGTWTVLTDAPRERDHFQSVLIGDKLYVAAGRLSGGTGGVHAPMISEVDVYDFIASSWSTLPAGSNLPTQRAGAAAVNFNDKLVVIGGEGNGQAWSTVESLNPTTNTWQSLTSLNIARHGTQAVVAGEGIFITSGSPLQANGNMTNMEVYSKENAPAEPPFVSGQLLSTSATIALTPVSVGNSSSTIVKIYNTGGSQGILLTDIDLQANPAEYELIHNLTYPIVIDVDDTVAFTVKYTPLTVNPVSGSIVISHNGNNPTLTLPLSGSVILPVAWHSFSVKEQEGNARLTWTTARELNNKHFVIERAQKGGVFLPIAMVEGAGNSTGIASYTYIDAHIFSLNSTELRYRLKQVDYDGLFSYSQQVELSLQAPFSAYPVPFKDDLTIRYSTSRFEKASIQVMSSIGQTIFQTDVLDNSGILHLNTHMWPKGIYFIQLKSSGADRTFKVLKL